MAKDEATLSGIEAIEKIRAGKEKILREVRKVIIGQDAVVEDVIAAFFAGGHCLITGVPGLAKTLLISSLGRALHLKFRRVQFTPDLMPSDITGSEILEEDRTTGQRAMKFRAGPIFTNILLADEINRTPPKTQAALLEAMQEHQVTVSGTTYKMEEPFFVLATQNPIEQEGTYPLPEIQQDRFMFSLLIDYLPKDQELAVVNATTGATVEDIQVVMDGQELPAPATATYSNSCGTLCRGAPRSARRTTWYWAPRRGRCCPAGPMCRSKTCNRWRPRFCGIGLSRTSGPSRRASTRKPSFAGCWRRSRRQRAGSSRPWPVIGECRAAPPRDTIMSETGYLDFDVIARIDNMQLLARVVVEGFVLGLHRSPYRGFSVEFAEYRQYSPGDEIKHIDWKVFGRTDRYYIKQFEEETNLACHILLDASGSMGYKSDPQALSKLEYGSYMAACLSYFIMRQRDAVGLTIFDNKVRTALPARMRQSHLKHVLAAL